MAEKQTVTEEVGNGLDEGGDLTPGTTFQSVRDTINASIKELEVDTDAHDTADISEDREVHSTDMATDDRDLAEKQEDLEPSPDDTKEETPEAEEVILAPTSWNKDDREGWEGLPRKIQETITRREEEQHKAISDMGREIGPLRAVIEEHQEYFQRRGVDPATSFKVLLQAENSLAYGTPQSKRQALEQIARDYGIPLDAKSPADQDEDDLADPDLAKAVAPITERLGRIEGQLTSRQQADDQAREDEAAQTSQRFFDDLEGMDPKDHPEVRYVKETLPQFQAMVGAELAAGRRLSVDNLKTIFRNAARATPGVYEAMQNDMAARAKAIPSPKADSKRVIKKVSSSVSSGAGGATHSKDLPKHESVRDTINRSIGELEGPGAIR